MFLEASKAVKLYLAAILNAEHLVYYFKTHQKQ